jgi:hypothetical protein
MPLAPRHSMHQLQLNGCKQRATKGSSSGVYYAVTYLHRATPTASALNDAHRRPDVVNSAARNIGYSLLAPVQLL